MPKVTISMPDDMKVWVEDRVKAGCHGNMSEYFRDLVRRDRDRKETAILELRELMDRAEQGGTTKRSFPEIIEAARKKARRQRVLREHD